MRYRIRTVTDLADVPLAVSVADAKAYLSFTASSQDGTIEGMIRTAQEMVEAFTGQVLTPREMEMLTCGFPVMPELISIPRDPVTGILAVSYIDASTGESIDLAEADWRWSDAAPEQLLPAWRQCWPVADSGLGGVRLRFNAGYDEGLCPAHLLTAVKKTVVQLFTGRGEGGRLSRDVQDGLPRPLLA